jgi:hypothetical protein
LFERERDLAKRRDDSCAAIACASVRIERLTLAFEVCRDR